MKNQLASNGVRMIYDHKLYAQFCEVADAIIILADQLNNTCTDLAPAVIEADWFLWLRDKVVLTRQEVDRWRTTGKQECDPGHESRYRVRKGKAEEAR